MAAEVALIRARTLAIVCPFHLEMTDIMTEIKNVTGNVTIVIAEIGIETDVLSTTDSVVCLMHDGRPLNNGITSQIMIDFLLVGMTLKTSLLPTHGVFPMPARRLRLHQLMSMPLCALRMTDFRPRLQEYPLSATPARPLTILVFRLRTLGIPFLILELRYLTTGLYGDHHSTTDK